MKTSTLALLVLAVLVAGCASPGAAPGPERWLWQGQPGAAAVQFGGQSAAEVAFRQHEAECEYESARAAAGSPPPPLAGGQVVQSVGAGMASSARASNLFGLCMAARGWRKG